MKCGRTIVSDQVMIALKRIVIVLFSVLVCLDSLSQLPDSYKNMVRIYEDDDFINIRGKGTDKGYTSGFKLDYFFRQRQSFLSKWLGGRKQDAISTAYLGVTHLIYTPRNLQDDAVPADDFPYSGALLVQYGIQADVPARKFNLQVGVQAGVMGPWAHAKEIQLFIHQLIGDEKPRGWDNQLPNDILLNISVSGEKQVVQLGRLAEIIAGMDLAAGSALNKAEIYSIIRFGKMNPYFSGIINRYSKTAARNSGNRMQAYFVARPALSYTASNPLLTGGIILRRENNNQTQLKHSGASLACGVVVVVRKFCISFTQKMFSTPVRTQGFQETGNISIHFSW